MLNLKEIADEFLALQKKQYVGIEEMRTFAEKHKLTYINKGRSRVACAIDDNLVVKFAIGKFGLDCNKLEYDKYQRIPDEQKKNYVQIFQCGQQYQYLVVERVISNTGVDEKPVPYNIKHLIEDSCSFNFGRRITNRGRYGYKWVVLDYAERY